ncbi:dna-binding sap domain-containing protein [Stemphylium lycopersici]|nr:dna-binding sap domain-containing protein [Stemphylium lycopersici]
MAALKPSIRAISALAAGPRLLGPRLTVRQLSMTGPTSSSSLLTTDKPYASNRSRGPIRLSGEQTFPVPEAAETGNKIRRFNTSRSRKSVGDTSTLDFAYIPDFDPETRSAPLGIRVPILPWADVQGHSAESEGVVPMQPTIYTVSADGTHIHSPSALSDTADNNQFDYQTMANNVASKFTATRQEGEGMIRQIWNDFMEDITGSKRGPSKA